MEYSIAYSPENILERKADINVFDKTVFWGMDIYKSDWVKVTVPNRPSKHYGIGFRLNEVHRLPLKSSVNYSGKTKLILMVEFVQKIYPEFHHDHIPIEIRSTILLQRVKNILKPVDKEIIYDY